MNNNKSLALIAFFSSLIIIARLLKFSLAVHLPGFGGFGWMLMLLTGRLVIPRRFAATELSTISGLIIAIAGLDAVPFLSIPAYLVTGLMLDCCYRLASLLHLGQRPGILIGGALSYTSHTAVKVLILSFVGIKMKAIFAWGLFAMFMLHVFFGALAGTRLYS